jgi:hypothetical protein
VSAPFYAVLSRIDMNDETREGIVAVAFVAASVVAMLWALLRLVPPRFAAAGAVVYGFGTTMWPIAAQALFQHGPVALFQAIGLRALFSKGSRAPFVAGLGFAAAATVRLAAAIPLAVIGLVYMTEGKKKTLRYVAGSLAPLVVIAVQNRWVWGSWITGGYVQFGTGFAGDMPRAAFELLFGWWRGIFVYSPVLSVAAVGWASSLRNLGGFVERRMAALGVIGIATVVLYARKSDWTAGLNQFGYRYLLDVVPFLVVLAAWAWSRSRRVALVAAPLAALSIMTMAYGMADNRFAWDGIESPKSFVDAPIGEAWIVFVHHPLWSVVRLLGVAAVSAVIWLIVREISSDRDELSAPVNAPA